MAEVMQFGVIGLPMSSKTTLFGALTGAVPDAAGGGTRFTIQRAIVDVPDPRVDVLAAMFKPRKVTRARVAFADIGGLQKGMGEGGLSGELLNTVALNDALLHVVRAFDDPDVPHLEGSVDPARDIAMLDNELLLSDLVIVEKRLEKIRDTLRRPIRPVEREAHEAEQAVLETVHAGLQDAIPARDLDLDEATLLPIRGFQLLTLKPVVIVVNTGDTPPGTGAALPAYDHRKSAVVGIRGRIEMEIAQLDPDDRALFMAEYGVGETSAARILATCYRLLGLHSFFTVGEDEVRAWTIPIGATALEAAGTIHTDLARGFIRAEVVSYDDLVALGGMNAARQAGKHRMEGRNYVVADGDILHVRFNV
ncbi:MAG: redox-regulated ATPase YchF [Ardenticatenales bacterium]|nr:redox-regulated ATPase YchF [Ardenticatenales bacterium]